MSGGSWNYAFRHVEEMGEGLKLSPDSVRRAFGEHLIWVAEAMRAVEWVDSCDYSPGDETEPIRKALGENADAIILDAARGRLSEEIARAEALLKKSRVPTGEGQ